MSSEFHAIRENIIPLCSMSMRNVIATSLPSFLFEESVIQATYFNAESLN